MRKRACQHVLRRSARKVHHFFHAVAAAPKFRKLVLRLRLQAIKIQRCWRGFVAGVVRAALAMQMRWLQVERVHQAELKSMVEERTRQGRWPTQHNLAAAAAAVPGSTCRKTGSGHAHAGQVLPVTHSGPAGAGGSASDLARQLPRAGRVGAFMRVSLAGDCRRKAPTAAANQRAGYAPGQARQIAVESRGRAGRPDRRSGRVVAAGFPAADSGRRRIWCPRT